MLTFPYDNKSQIISNTQDRRGQNIFNPVQGSEGKTPNETILHQQMNDTVYSIGTFPFH